ncbi:unnamed protein product [Miscanthus lutarioriparius]|uniref:Uncharacterized protein n=1 Tax=Miscanthus lutarioriparius TaxID=422564 RepID=A0A811PPS4_9POAL|nr:unnamed protein product [Miscanthus lutarioriparius]
MSSCVGETGLVAMDCLVVCCCCPCLVLQVTVFLFVRLPRKVVVKTKRIILRRWHRRRSSSSSSKAAGLKLADLLDLDDGFEAAFGIGEEEGAGDWKERCFAVGGGDDEIDGVWEAITEQEGLFWFGSFWGRHEQEGSASQGDDRMDGSFRLPVALERISIKQHDVRGCDLWRSGGLSGDWREDPADLTSYDYHR